MASISNECCPVCGSKLFILQSGDRYCTKCKKVFQDDDSDESSGVAGFLITSFTILIVLLLLAVAGFFIYRAIFSHYDYDKYYEKEYAPYFAALSERLPDLVSTDEAIETEYHEGEPIRVLGVVDEVGDNLIGLNNDIDCYIIPDTPGDVDANKMSDLGWLKSGDVVGISGMVCNTSPLTLKYCGVPYIYYDGLKFYNEYESYRAGVMYHDVAYSDEDYSRYIGLVKNGDVLYQSASDILNAFRTGGTVTEDSFYYGSDYYRDRALSISGKVIQITDDYFNVDGIYCFYSLSLLTNTEAEIISSLQRDDHVTVSGLVCNPSLDSFRMKYCSIDDVISEETSSNSNAINGGGMISEALYAVLEGKEQFLNRGYLFNPSMSEYQYCDEISDGSDTYATQQFAIVDMDGDGTNEVVLLGDSGRDGAYTVLHEYDGKVYGHMEVYRGMESLLQNGLHQGSMGYANDVIKKITFNGADAESVTMAEYDYDQRFIGDRYSTTPNGREVTKQEFDDYLTQIGWNEDAEAATFYDYAEGNILSLLAS